MVIVVDRMIPKEHRHVYDLMKQYEMQANPFRDYQLLALLENECGLKIEDRYLRRVRTPDGDFLYGIFALVTDKFVIMLEDHGNGWYTVWRMISLDTSDLLWQLKYEDEIERR